MRKALQITTDGDKVELDLDGKQGSYDTLRKGVGGYIEAVTISADLTLWVNEEGKLIGLPINPVATRLWEKRFGVGTDTIRGNVVLTGGVDNEGDTLGLTKSARSLIERLTPEFAEW